MTAAQAATRLGVSVTTVRRATRAGALPCRQIGEWGIRYAEEDLQEWVAAIATRRHRPRRAPAPSRDHTAVERADIPRDGGQHKHPPTH